MPVTAAPDIQPVGRTQQRRTYLMCRPEHFAVRYRINPWMDPTRPVDVDLARRQWGRLRDVFLGLGHHVELIEPVPDLPDMVFAANGGFTLDGIALAASFRHRERAPEAAAYSAWFAGHGFEVVEPTDCSEGEGDLLLAGGAILAGWGFRSARAGHAQVAEVFGRPVVPLRLVDPRFYHLDMTVAVLGAGDDGHVDVAYLPEAFDDAGRGVLAERFPDAIRISAEDGLAMAGNAVGDGRNVVVPAQATRFRAQLRERGYRVVPVDVSEFAKAGGSAKCCTLNLRRGP